MNGFTSSKSVAVPVQHPDNLLNTGSIPVDLEAKLQADGIRFATKLQTPSGHTFLLCGRRCPCEAGADMLRDALPVKRHLQATLSHP